MLSPPCVLIVDDDAYLRALLRYRLQCRGVFTIFEAADGLQALALLTQLPIALVLLDLGLPGLDGLEVARRIRALPPPAGQVPILMVSAFPAWQYASQAQAIGCNGYIQKPIDDFAAFYETVLQLLPYP